MARRCNRIKASDVEILLQLFILLFGGTLSMKTTKEFPATHSMDTEWFIADAEGNIALFDFDDDGPVPAKIADNDDFWGGLDEIGVPDKDGINSFELTDEQANCMLRHFKPISDFSTENEYDCLVQIKDDEESLKTFIRTNVEF